MAPRGLEIRGTLERDYADVYTPEALAALSALAPLDADRKALMAARIARRAARARERRRIAFLDPGATIGRHRASRVQDARDGEFAGSEIPADLQRQWIQGTGPGRAARARRSTTSIRNVAYALLSGADGWMFDGEDALGQVVDDVARQPAQPEAGDRPRRRCSCDVAEQVAAEMNAWARGLLRPPDRRRLARSSSTSRRKIFRARGLHLDDRHVRHADGARLLGLDRRRRALRRQQPRARCAPAGASLVALPAEDPDRRGGGALERHPRRRSSSTSACRSGTIKVYVLVEQLEACFQLMEIRAALGPHFVGFNTGRWDYINSVSDAMAWDPAFVNPNIDAITMTYGYMRNYEDRVRRAVNTPDRNGRFALWQGGMEPNIPVGSAAGVAGGMKRAVAGAEREQREGASGKWVAHWKMVHIVRPVWEKVGRRQPARPRVPAAHLHAGRRRRAAAARAGAAHRPRRPRSAERRAAVRQRLRPGPAGGRAQARRLLRQRRRALPDGGHGDRRDPPEHPLGVAAQGRARSPTTTRRPASRRATRSRRELFARLLDEEYAKLLRGRQPRRARRLEDDDAARSRARSSTPTCSTRRSCPGTSIS